MEKLFLERRGAKYKISQNISNISPGKIFSESHRMIFHSYWRGQNVKGQMEF